MGTPEFAVPTLKALHQSDSVEVLAVFTQPDRQVGRGLEVKFSPVKQVATELNYTIFQPENLSTEFETIKKLKPDLIVVVAYGQLIKKNIIELPTLGCLNIHSSLLPRWRGAAPIHRALLHGDQITGVTIMMIAEKLDAGDILAQKQTKIEKNETAQSLHDRLAEMGAELIVPTLLDLKNNVIQPVKQKESLVTYAHKLTKEMEILEFTETAQNLDLKIRALNPWPGTAILVQKENKIERLKIKEARFLETTQNKNPQVKQLKPGYLYYKNEQLIYPCRQGCLEILKLQPEGKKEISAQEYGNYLKGQKKLDPQKCTLPKILAPSLLSADFSKLSQELAVVEAQGIRWHHVDIMDGHFVPNLTIGPVVVQSLRSKTFSILDCHLMVSQPGFWIENFIKAGADIITVHAESFFNQGESAFNAASKRLLEQTIQKIKQAGLLVGISIKPATPVEIIQPFLNEMDLVLVMSVEPGFGGQTLIPECIKKIQTLKTLRDQSIEDKKYYHYLIQVDGGIHLENISLVAEAGADVMVAGTAVYGQKSKKTAIEQLKSKL